MIALGGHLVVKLYPRHTADLYQMSPLVSILVTIRPTTNHLQTTSGDTLLNVREAADALGVTPWWTRRLIASGDLRAINIGGPDKSARWRVAPEDLAAFIRSRENRARDLIRRESSNR